MLNIRSVFDDRSAAAMGLNTFWSNIYGILETNLKSETTIVFLMKNYIEWLVQILISLDIENFHFFTPETFRAHFFENFYEKMKSPKSIQDHSGMVPGAPGHQKTFKNLQIFPWEGLGASGKNLKKSSENIVLNDFLDVFFQIFPCWRMYCPCGSLSGKPLAPPRATRGQYMRQHMGWSPSCLKRKKHTYM